MSPEIYLKEFGLLNYDLYFICKKKHKYIDTCIKNDFKCTINIRRRDMADDQNKADYIRSRGVDVDYEAEAIESIARSWELDDPTCQQLALMDAQVWATLHLARTSNVSVSRYNS